MLHGLVRHFFRQKYEEEREELAVLVQPEAIRARNC